MPKVVELMREKPNRTREKLSKTLQKLREGKADHDTALVHSALTRIQSKHARERRQLEKRPPPKLTVVSSNIKED